MTRKKRRLILMLAILTGAATATGLMLKAFEENIVYFHTPSTVDPAVLGTRGFRLGGLVETGSIQRQADGVTIHFRVTDNQASLPVSYKGVLPALFREGKGVIAEGRLGQGGIFVAHEVLAKHDENYMPPEVAKALEKGGHPGQASTGTLAR